MQLLVFDVYNIAITEGNDIGSRRMDVDAREAVLRFELRLSFNLLNSRRRNFVPRNDGRHRPASNLHGFLLGNSLDPAAVNQICEVRHDLLLSQTTLSL